MQVNEEQQFPEYGNRINVINKILVCPTPMPTSMEFDKFTIRLNVVCRVCGDENGCHGSDSEIRCGFELRDEIAFYSSSLSSRRWESVNKIIIFMIITIISDDDDDGDDPFTVMCETVID